ncbi:MAG: electron transfer flavoprotein subunit beta/FixA family protein [Rubricoccaceae bacterium]
MRFSVCINQVPDVSAPSLVRDGQLVLDAGRVVLDAYAASAVEAALVLQETHGGEVEVVLIGAQKASETIRKALAMGADSGVHLLVSEDADLDSQSVTSLLADHYRAAAPDVILAGKQSQDTDAGLVGGMLAEALGRPYVTNAVGLAQEGDALVVTRQGDKGQEVIELPAPCVVTCSNDMNDPRIPKLKNIMASKKKPVETREVSPATPALRTVAYETPPAREPGKTVPGEPAEAARELVRLLADEARAL